MRPCTVITQHYLSFSLNLTSPVWIIVHRDTNCIDTVYNTAGVQLYFSPYVDSYNDVLNSIGKAIYWKLVHKIICFTYEGVLN